MFTFSHEPLDTQLWTRYTRHEHTAVPWYDAVGGMYSWLYHLPASTLVVPADDGLVADSDAAGFVGIMKL